MNALVLALALFTPQQTAFDKRMDRLLAECGAPGVAVRVVTNGRTVYERQFGVADIETKKPATVKMAFEIGSLSKQFAAACLLMLVQEGKISLNERIGDVLPGLPESWRAATIDQILHHMSGIPDYEAIATYDFYNSPRKPQEIIDQAKKVQPAFKPGEKFDYSNTGYFLISLAVEKRSGMSQANFLHKRIFQPLGMKSTYADPRPRGVVPMTGYHSRSGSRKAQPPIAWTSTLGAGGIVSTLDDLVKWDQSLYTEKLLPKDLRDKLWTPTKLNSGATNAYGYGWFSTRYRGQLELNHSGQTNGFTCFYRRFPELKTSVFTFANTYGGRIFNIEEAAVSHFVPGVSYRKLPVPQSQDVARNARHIELLRMASFGKPSETLFTTGIRDFAKEDRFADSRKELQGYIVLPGAFVLVRTSQRKLASGATVDDFLYRQDIAPEPKFWTLGFIEGKLSGIRVEDE